jgi:small-conductance mechanosensitive channel
MIRFRGEMVKIYLLSISVFLLFWVTGSTLYEEPVWWSIYSSSRSTHTPLSEQISLIKLIIAAVILLGITAAIRNRLSK